MSDKSYPQSSSVPQITALVGPTVVIPPVAEFAPGARVRVRGGGYFGYMGRIRHVCYVGGGKAASVALDNGELRYFGSSVLQVVAE